MIWKKNLYHNPRVAGPDLQNKGWVGHYACVVEVGLAMQHWSGKLKGVLSTASMSMLLLGDLGDAPQKILKLLALRLNLRAFQTYY